MLSRIYGSEGGSQLLDVLMKYLYAFSSPMSRSFWIPLLISTSNHQIQGNVAYLSAQLWTVIFDTPGDWRVLANTVKRWRRGWWSSHERAA